MKIIIGGIITSALIIGGIIYIGYIISVKNNTSDK